MLTSNTGSMKSNLSLTHDNIFALNALRWSFNDTCYVQWSAGMHDLT